MAAGELTTSVGGATWNEVPGRYTSSVKSLSNGQYDSRGCCVLRVMCVVRRGQDQRGRMWPERTVWRRLVHSERHRRPSADLRPGRHVEFTGPEPWVPTPSQCWRQASTVSSIQPTDHISVLVVWGRIALNRSETIGLIASLSKGT